ncbi:hypothetical protein D9M70_393380 [compost metagenome]
MRHMTNRIFLVLMEEHALVNKRSAFIHQEQVDVIPITNQITAISGRVDQVFLFAVKFGQEHRQIFYLEFLYALDRCIANKLNMVTLCYSGRVKVIDAPAVHVSEDEPRHGLPSAKLVGDLVDL